MHAIQEIITKPTFRIIERRGAPIPPNHAPCCSDLTTDNITSLSNKVKGMLERKKYIKAARLKIDISLSVEPSILMQRVALEKVLQLYMQGKDFNRVKELCKFYMPYFHQHGLKVNFLKKILVNTYYHSAKPVKALEIMNTMDKSYPKKIKKISSQLCRFFIAFGPSYFNEKGKVDKFKDVAIMLQTPSVEEIKNESNRFIANATSIREYQFQEALVLWLVRHNILHITNRLIDSWEKKWPEAKERLVILRSLNQG